MSYAWSINRNRLEWLFLLGRSKSECLQKASDIVNSTAKYPPYSAPFGCGYGGNSYWRVLFFNALYGGAELGCIAQSYNQEVIDAGMRYSPVLGRDRKPEPGENWSCVR